MYPRVSRPNDIGVSSKRGCAIVLGGMDEGELQVLLKQQVRNAPMSTLYRGDGERKWRVLISSLSKGL
jgi:hypothetical protein